MNTFRSAEIWHFATHHTFDWADYLSSGLEFGTDEKGRSRRLTTEDLLYRVAQAAPRLVMLTVCESGLSEMKEFPDEALGMSTAFLQVGSAGVISTLWDVDDLATALIVGKFYEGLLADGISPPEALGSALRDADTDEIVNFVQERQAGLDDAYAFMLADLAAAAFALPPGEPPFADVKYWGGFVYVGA